MLTHRKKHSLKTLEIALKIFANKLIFFQIPQLGSWSAGRAAKNIFWVSKFSPAQIVLRSMESFMQKNITNIQNIMVLCTLFVLAIYDQLSYAY